MDGSSDPAWRHSGASFQVIIRAVRIKLNAKRKAGKLLPLMSQVTVTVLPAIIEAS